MILTPDKIEEIRALERVIGDASEVIINYAHIQEIAKAVEAYYISASQPSVGWRKNTEADFDVMGAANLCRPKLGDSYTRAEMGSSGMRYAFIFNNPYDGTYVFMMLPIPVKP